MGRSIVCAWLVATACGRIGFGDGAGGGGGGGGGGTGDGATSGDVGATVDAPSKLSCAGLPATCGPAGASECCASVLVPGGTFDRSYDVASDAAYPDMSNPATLSDVQLDVYEITVGRFRQFVSAGLGTQAQPPPANAGARTLDGVADQAGWDASWNASLAATTAALTSALNCSPQWATWTNAAGANEDLAINCITWFEAFAFCAWDGGFLPTEAEWNYAASGGDEQRAYPWSSPPGSVTIDCTYANYDPMPECVNAPNGAVNRVGSESPKGDGKWGHADLGGNVQEWTLDWSATYANPCTDCADLTAASARALRGGDFRFFGPNLRVAKRYSSAPTTRGGEIGARCARR